MYLKRQPVRKKIPKKDIALVLIFFFSYVGLVSLSFVFLLRPIVDS